MSFLTAEQCLQATGGTWCFQDPPGDRIHRISIDSRDVTAGTLFLAIAGEQHDGHEFIEDAIAAGATALVLERGRCSLESCPVPVLLVQRTSQALVDLACSWRSRLEDTVVIGITGSAGKTTTRAMLESILRQVFTGTASIRSFNNDIGLPLTILAADTSDQFLLCEVGTNNPGEIALLSNILRPRIAVITTIGESHLEGLGSLAGIADEKTDLIRSLSRGGIGLIPSGLPLLDASLSRSPAHGATIRHFGVTAGDVPRLIDRRASVDGLGQVLQLEDGRSFMVPLVGEHHASNAIAAIAVADILEVPAGQIQQGLDQFEHPSGRQAITCINGITVVDDSYNANPLSMQAALRSLPELTPAAGRRFAVLGDMLELGEQSRDLHEALGGWVGEFGFDGLLLVGPMMRSAAAVLDDAPVHVGHIDQFDAVVVSGFLQQLQPGDALLLKGSRKLGLERCLGLIQVPEADHVDGCGSS